MVIRLFSITPIIYYSFAFDSLLKIDLGFQIHLGVLAILCLNLYFMLRKPSKLMGGLNNDKLLIGFILFALMTGVVFTTPGYKQIAVYLFIAFNVALFCHYSLPSIGTRQLLTFQWIMIATGLLQFLVFKAFDYQIAFIDAAHYEKGYSVTQRLRGFFVEPNWYAIAISFNSLLLYGRNPRSIAKKYVWVTVLSLVVMLLNGTLTTLAVLAFVYFATVFRQNPIRGIFIGAALIVIIWGFLSYRASLLGGADTTRVLNHNSRVLPVLRVASYQSEQTWQNVLFGHGLGSWGTKAVENRLSVLVYEINATSRDGSELPVFLFELGIVGTLFFLLYLLNKYIRFNKNDFHLKGAVLLFFCCFVLYPTLKFWMYMPYFFYAVSFMNEQKYSYLNKK